MTDITDEDLNAYLDNELDAPRRAIVQEALSSDEGLAERYANLVEVKLMLGAQLSAIDDIPMPTSLMALLQEKSPEAKTADNVISLAQVRSQAKPKEQISAKPAFKWPAFNMSPTMMAASLAGLVGLGTGYFFNANKPTMAANHDIMAIAFERTGPVNRMLDKTLSGQEVALGGQGVAVVKATFVSIDKQLCREFEVRLNQDAVNAVACRTDDKNWQVRLASQARTKTVDQTGYQTASADDDTAFGRTVSELMASDPMSNDEEKTILSKGWKK